MTTSDLGAAITAAIQDGHVAHLDGGTYTITSPIVVRATDINRGALGIDGHGATLVSQVTSGEPLIQIVADAGVDLRYLTLSNFKIVGNGSEGNGIEIVADGNDRWVYNWSIDNVTVEQVGGYGLDVQGSVFEGVVSNSWMNDNAKGGAHFAHSADDGQVSALRWFGGGFKDNGGDGLTLDNGARDMSIDGASFVGNNGAGISAPYGITSVSSSTFEDNHGPGVWFQNYGNFYDDKFVTSGPQTVGISGYLAGGDTISATLVGNTSTYTGGGSDPTALADLQGSGGVFLSAESGKIVTGPAVSVNDAGAGNMADVSVDAQGVVSPMLAPVTAATTQNNASSDGSSALEAALAEGIAGGIIAHLTDGAYTVTSPIVINITDSSQTAIGVDLGGAKIDSQITDGRPVIEIIVAPGVDVSNLTLSNFSVFGNGSEGDGIRIIADGSDRSIQDLRISNVNVEYVGGIGLDVVGNISQGTVFNSWMHGDGQGGARFANSAGGGIVSGIEWVGGGFRKNDVAGLIVDNGAHDVAVKGAYFVENSGPGIAATSGMTLVQGSGFENNHGAGAIVHGPAAFIDDSFSTYGVQEVGVGGFLDGGQITLTGIGSEYYGEGTDPTTLANVQGDGTLAIASGGNVVVGPNVTVTGGDPSRAAATDVALSAGQSAVETDHAQALVGTVGDDVIEGTSGTTEIMGGAGADVLTGGSSGTTYVYGTVDDSTATAPDTITGFQPGYDKIDFTNIAGIKATDGVPQFQGDITGSGSATLEAHSVAYVEAGGNTQVLVNTTDTPETVTATDTHAADMKIMLLGVNLGLGASDFHHA
ncbi:M10 family metallopeptidase C-terminal domain-containing protein [Vineibacter terrae]|nr:M10 family metallopeptidase C-terminal domain-containing protein [Vineibacter terrae]